MSDHSRTPAPTTALHRSASGPSAPWAQLWSADGPALADAGMAGERMVATARLFVNALVVLFAAYALQHQPPLPESAVGLAAAGTAATIAAVIFLLTRGGVYRRWLGFATSIYDVTSISAALAVFLALGLPHASVNSRVVYELYLLALACTCLRHDPRICLVAGTVATVQYGGIVWWAGTHWPSLPSPSELEYGRFSLGDQVGRLAILAIATFICTVIATRTVQLRRLSIRDGLTGLMNRSFFEARFQEELLRAGRYGHPLAIALVDIDRFKEFNDSFGHPAGDAALRAVAQLLRDAVRVTDLVARYGGEEFVLVLPETDVEGAMRTLEHARQAVAGCPIRVARRSAPVSLTISGGVAVWPLDGDWPDELLHVADDRLLAAKRGGRNRIFGPGVRPEEMHPAAAEPVAQPL